MVKKYEGNLNQKQKREENTKIIDLLSFYSFFYGESRKRPALSITQQNMRGTVRVNFKVMMPNVTYKPTSHIRIVFFRVDTDHRYTHIEVACSLE